MQPLHEIVEEYTYLTDRDDRTTLIIELGNQLEPMEAALKTDETLVKGCASQVWVYPTFDGSKLHFQADSTSGLTKGVIALVLATVQDRTPAEVVSVDIAQQLSPFDLRRQLTPMRTQGVPSMIALIKATAARLLATP